jgi:DNA-binding transcriptional regulator YiaG
VSPTEIRALRQRLGLTQLGLAVEARVSERQVARWEAGTSHPKGARRRRLERLARDAAADGGGRTPR